MKQLSLILCCLFVFIACEEDDDILEYSKARNCLDEITGATATPAATRACVNGLAGDNSPRANKLRCAAEFLGQGLTTSNLADIFSDVQGETGGDLNNTLELLTFEGADANDAVAISQTAFGYCNASASVGMAMFGSFAYTATLTAQLTGWTGTGTPTLDGAGGLPATNDVQLGTAILNIQSVYCGQGSASDDICGQITTILNGSTDPATIGAQLRNYIN
jgi:hypothetical protein